MKSIAPKLNMQVPNSLKGDGVLGVEVSFDSMDSFSPAELARQIEPLARLLEARTQLANLLTYMDGKSGAEELLSRLLQQPELLRALAGRPPQALTMDESQPDQDNEPKASGAHPMTSTQTLTATRDTAQLDELSSLLQQEFRPKTEQAQQAVEFAVTTLAEQALDQSVTLSDDAYQTIQAVIAQIDQKMTE